MEIEQLEKMAMDTILEGVEAGGLQPRILVIVDHSFFYFDYGGDDDQLAKMREVIQRIVIAARITGRFQSASMIAEAWVSSDLSGVQPRNAPDKREGMLYVVYTPTARKSRAWLLERDGKKISLGKESQMNDFEGWLDKAMVPFPAHMLTPGVIAGAEALLAGVFANQKRKKEAGDLHAN